MSQETSKIIVKAAGVILDGRRLLMCRKRGDEFYITPGGKLEDGESAEQALARELMEELGVDLASASYLGVFDGLHTSLENISIRMETFLCKIVNTPQPQAEIEEIKWVNSRYESEGIQLSRINCESVLPALVSRNLID